MEYTEFRARLKEPSGWYLFVGEEEYLKRYCLGEMKKAVCPIPDLDTFNYTVFDGADIDLGALREALIAPPLMSDKKFVVWKYADFTKMRENAQKTLEELLAGAKDHPETVFVITADADGFDVGSLPKRPSPLYRRFEKKVTIVHFPRSTEAGLLAWLKKHFDAAGIRTDAPTLTAMIGRCGHNMDVLLGEVKKLTCYAAAHGRDQIDPQDVSAVCCSVAEEEAFALSDAVYNRDREAALRALTSEKNERSDPALVLGSLCRIYSELSRVARLCADGMSAEQIAQATGMNPYRAKTVWRAAKAIGVRRTSAALSALAQMDADFKGAGRSGWTPIETFLCIYL